MSDKTRDALGVLRGKRVADHVADVVSDEVGALDLQLVEHARDVGGLRLLVEAARGLRRQPHATQVRHDDGVVAHEVDGHRRPHVAGLAVAVQKNDGGPGSAEAHMNGGAVGRDIPDVEVRRKLERLHAALHNRGSVPLPTRWTAWSGSAIRQTAGVTRPCEHKFAPENERICRLSADGTGRTLDMTSTFCRFIFLSVLSGLVAACAATAEQQAQRDDDRCAARGLQPQSKAHDDCVIGLRAQRDVREQQRHRELVERPAATPYGR